MKYVGFGGCMLEIDLILQVHKMLKTLDARIIVRKTWSDYKHKRYIDFAKMVLTEFWSKVGM
jgi:hypothetical protein